LATAHGAFAGQVDRLSLADRVLLRAEWDGSDSGARGRAWKAVEAALAITGRDPDIERLEHGLTRWAGGGEHRFSTVGARRRRTPLTGPAPAHHSGRDSNGMALMRSPMIDAMLGALGARLEIEMRWQGAAVSRVVDEGHASLVGSVVRWLDLWHWQSRLEVSFALYGERGSIDILAWHSATRTLLIIEIKTELGSVEGLLRPLDAKVRLAPSVAAERFGWKAERVGCVVVFPESGAVRRQLARHATVFDAAFGARSREVRRWLRKPAGELRGRWFLSDSHQPRTTPNPSAVQRVRRAASPLPERERGT
jgi:hypothetical protein